MTQGCFSLVKECLQQHGLFCFSHHSTIDKAQGAQGAQKEYSWKGWPKGHPISHEITISKKNGEKKEKERALRVVAFVVPGHCNVWLCNELCFPGESWTTACPWEVVNQLLAFLCLCTLLLPSLSKCLYLSYITSFLSPIALCGERVRGYVWLSCLLGLAQMKISLYFKWKNMFVYLQMKD